MQCIDEKQINEVGGAGAWDDFWNWVGRQAGDSLAESAYSSGSKRLHDIGAGKGEQSLDSYLAGQTDPLL
ncbi:hypothetical protein ACFO4O_00685 [Glaciecola siphonariae]|uniref:Uncharacterized protein n=1 Tax=Glaciecola siphonariae TaxID=521012 RepID=A0ABV9LRC0_9ALTE